MAIVVKGKTEVDPELKRHDVLWRYLDTAKFLALLGNQQLYFPRGDQFEDKFEGAFTKSIRHAIEASYSANQIEFSFEEFKRRLRERVFVNCWHRSRDDSMAMWGLYGGSSCAVAVTTTVDQLATALDAAKLPYEIAMRKVTYVKHWREPELNIKPYSNVFAYKVKAYDFEKEVRVILDQFHQTFNHPSSDHGVRVPVKLNSFLRSIVVSPESPPWYMAVIENCTKQYGVTVDVRRSKLAFDPI